MLDDLWKTSKNYSELIELKSDRAEHDGWLEPCRENYMRRWSEEKYELELSQDCNSREPLK